MIARYMLNKDVMLAPYGVRSLSKQDPDYNNAAIIVPYSNWQGPIWINANYLNYIALKRYGFDKEAAELSGILGRMVLADIQKWGSMHEDYDAETGAGLAPTPEQSANHVFSGIRGMESAGAGHAAVRGERRVPVSAGLWFRGSSLAIAAACPETAFSGAEARTLLRFVRHDWKSCPDTNHNGLRMLTSSHNVQQQGRRTRVDTPQSSPAWRDGDKTAQRFSAG